MSSKSASGGGGKNFVRNACSFSSKVVASPLGVTRLGHWGIGGGRWLLVRAHFASFQIPFGLSAASWTWVRKCAVFAFWTVCFLACTAVLYSSEFGACRRSCLAQRVASVHCCVQKPWEYWQGFLQGTEWSMASRKAACICETCWSICSFVRSSVDILKTGFERRLCSRSSWLSLFQARLGVGFWYVT